MVYGGKLTAHTTQSLIQKSDTIPSYQNQHSTDQQRPAASFLAPDIAFLAHYGARQSTLENWQEVAENNNVEAHEELIARGAVSEQLYYKCLAHDLGLRFLQADSLGQIVGNANHKGLIHSLRHAPRIFIRSAQSNKVTLVTAPKRKEASQLRTRLKLDPTLKHRIAIAAPQDIKKAYLSKLGTPLNTHATHMLRHYMPSYSAFSVKQTKVIITVITLSGAAIMSGLFPTNLWTIVFNITLALMFFLATCLRFLAALTLRRNKALIPELSLLPNRELPVYSVLVALYDEADIVSDLVAALSNLDWPASKLDIKLALEADDLATINAAQEARKQFPAVELVIIPPGDPRTKPRALNYALPLARGEFVVIYDAEDRPDPLQLRAAYHRFSTGHKDIVCLQAPLLVDNDETSWLSRLYEIEYSSLFDGLLPAFAHWQLPILLGGTSNHFRINVLRAIGAWDPYNVTEDADLGLRLKRLGYRVEMIDQPTYEEAPATLKIWLKQRTRWFKGWMQTSIVHMRNPRQMYRELGFSGFLSYHLMSTALLASAFGYPFFMGLLGYHIINGTLERGFDPVFLLVFNLVFAFFVYIFLAFRALSYRNKGSLFRHAFTFPAYWFLSSIAVWRALYQLATAPHHWEKTPHGQVKRQIAPWQQSTRQKMEAVTLSVLQ